MVRFIRPVASVLIGALFGLVVASPALAQVRYSSSTFYPSAVIYGTQETITANGSPIKWRFDSWPSTSGTINVKAVTCSNGVLSVQYTTFTNLGQKKWIASNVLAGTCFKIAAYTNYSTDKHLNHTKWFYCNGESW